MESKAQAWIAFAVAAMKSTRGDTVREDTILAASIADRMADQWDARFGDAAFLIDGQSECGACHKPLPDGSDFTPSVDGVKFCGIPCLKASGREE